MTSSRLLGAVAGAAILLATTMPAQAKPPEKLILTPQSTDALLILKTDWWSPAPNNQSAYKIVCRSIPPMKGRSPAPSSRAKS